MWVLDHLADLESDLSRFHRIDDMYALDGPKFFRLAWRLSAYRGVMAMRLEQQQHVVEPRPASSSHAAPARPARRSQSVERSLSAFTAQHPDMIEWKKVT